MDDLIDRLEGLLAKATPGPWYFDRWRAALGVDGRQIVVKSFALSSGEEPEANATLIVEAINALPALLAERRRLKAENARLLSAGDDLADAVRSSVHCGQYPSLTEALAEWGYAALQETERDHS